MIRFKVVRASRLALGAAVLILIVTLAVILLRGASGGTRQPRMASASLAAARPDEARAQAAFAFSNAAEAPQTDAAPGIEIEVVGDGDLPAVTNHPSVLIYHTHTHEAYEQVAEDPYDAVETWRTTDARHSVVRVGEALAAGLEARGFEVVHDTTDHEDGPLATAYTRSLQTLESYARAFDLYIDLHRDAWSEGIAPRYVSDDGTSFAQPMLLVGNGEGFEEKPFYEQNLAFAKLLTERINRRYPGLCREVLVKDGRYNQHIGVFSVLIEVGHNRNTLPEALNTASVIADALDSLMIQAPNPQLDALRRRADDGRARNAG